ncbi:long-chain fatty acid--CoA ligase [Cytobacillus firmus]|uniref:acyl-CoA synthetase n=1 Tax=Cytobacillus firmus TaxID=1399 RepID=UPI0036BF2C58
MINEGNINFSSIIKKWADENPSKEVIVYDNKRITYKELNERVSALSQGLLSLGIEKGDRVGVLLYNCSEFLEIIFAVNRIGAIFLPLNYRLAPDELAYILKNAGAKAIISEEAFLESINCINEDLNELKHYISLEVKDDPTWKSYPHLVEVNMGVQIPDMEVDLNDLHRLMYTSGTTSRPKGVKISYENLYWKNIGHIWNFNIGSEDKTLIVGPLYHVGGLDLPATGVLHRGGSVVILRKFNPVEVLKTIETEKPTNVWMAPAMVNMLLQYEKAQEYNLDSIRFIIAGGERMPEPLIEKIQALFKNAWFCDAYGLTETVSGDTFLPRSKTFEKLGSVGKPCMHLEMKIVNDEGIKVQEGEIGEIVFRGPKVTKGYWNNEEATQKAIRNGWFHTGDMGYLDKDEYLYITDRKKDMIVSGGENIASLEVERVLYENPKVLEAAVIGIPHQKWGEVPKAYIVLKDGLTVTETELLTFCRSKLAKYKVPYEIEFIDELPRNPSGKVLKRELRENRRQRA